MKNKLLIFFGILASLLILDSLTGFAFMAQVQNVFNSITVGDITITDDIDDEHIEGDLNTYVDIAGDTMTGPLNATSINTTNLGIGSCLTFFNATSNCQQTNCPTSTLHVC